MNTVEFLQPPKKEGNFFDNLEEIRNLRTNKNDGAHLRIDGFITNTSWSSSPYSQGYSYEKANRDQNDKLISFWCPFGSNMVYGIIDDNHKEWVDLWAIESRFFFRGDESHPDSHKDIDQRQNKCDFLTEGNSIFGFASLADAMKYISISNNSSKERKYLDDQILRFIGNQNKSNKNGDFQKAPPIGSSVVLDPIAVLGKVSIELRKSAFVGGNEQEYRKCVKEEALVTFNKEFINVVLYNIKLAGVKRIRINKDNESMFRVHQYERIENGESYHSNVRNILSTTTPSSEIDKKFHKEVVNGDHEIDREERGSVTTVIKEEMEENKILDGFMGKEESNDIKFTLIPVSKDDLDDEETLDKVIEIADEALEKEEKGLSQSTDEMIATEKFEKASKVIDEDDMEDMSIEEIESIAVEGDEELEEEDLDDTDYSDHIEDEKGIEIPDECRIKLKI